MCSQPPSFATPWTCITFEPMPSIAAPILFSIRARSCTCGSQAALRITVVPAVAAAAISAFSVPITDGSSMKKSHGVRPPSGALMTMSWPCSTFAPSARNASRCGSSRRRPITSPPGGGIVAAPNRASSGPAARNEARMRSARAASTSVLVTFAAFITTVFGLGRSMRHAEVLEQLEQRLGVPDVRDVVQRHVLVREQRAGQQRQRGVLVSGGHDGAGQRHAAFDDELLHGGGG